LFVYQLRNIAIKYRSTAAAAAATNAPTTTPTPSTDADELLTTGPTEIPSPSVTSSEGNKVFYTKKKFHVKRIELNLESTITR